MSKFWSEIDVGEQNQSVFSCDWVDDHSLAVVDFWRKIFESRK